MKYDYIIYHVWDVYQIPIDIKDTLSSVANHLGVSKQLLAYHLNKHGVFVTEEDIAVERIPKETDEYEELIDTIDNATCDKVQKMLNNKHVVKHAENGLWVLDGKKVTTEYIAEKIERMYKNE